MLATSRAAMTAGSSTLQKRAIFCRISRGNGAVGAAEQDVGLDADGEHLLDGVLGGLGLELLRGGDPGDERDVDEAGVVAAEVLAHLADGFEEGQRFDVADGAADLDDGDVGSPARPCAWRS